MRWDMPRSICVANLKFLGIPIPNLWKGVQNLEILLLNSQHTSFGEFCYLVICKMGHVKIYLCTQFDVSSYTTPVQNLWKGVQNLAPKPPPHPTLGNFVNREMGHVNIYPCTKFEVSSFTRSQFRGSINLAHGPPPHSLLGVFFDP